MRYARIDNERAVEFFDYDGDVYDVFPRTLLWVSCDTATKAGDIYNDATKTFSTPSINQSEINALRVQEIKNSLTLIDAQSTRPLRAKLSGTGTAEDEARLASLEAQAQTLRTELAGL